MPAFSEVLSIFLITCLGVCACGTYEEQIKREDTQSRLSDVECIEGERDVEFQGISFRYDFSTFGSVRSEVVPEWRLQEPDNKPDGVAPEHVLFTFDLGREYSKAELAVYPVKEFPEMYGVSRHWVNGIQMKTQALQKVLKDKTFRLEGEIPHLPYADASQDFHSKVEHFDFMNGKGILFVMHWSHGVGLISNKNLIYRFEGLTNDGKFYITGEMPIKAGFLPDESPNEFEGYTYENLFEYYRNPKTKKQSYNNYINSITGRLEKMDQTDFNPRLEKFESLISTLKVTK